MAVSLCRGFQPQAPDSSLLAAMESELHRSMDSLKLRGRDGPYFLSYMLWDIQSYRVEASMGSLEKSAAEPLRFMDVDLRVGSYELDQSLYQGGVVFGPRLRAPIPESNDTLLLRQALWAQTDARYKVALEQLAQKKSFLTAHQDMDALPDWSRQKVLQQRDLDSIIPPDTAAWMTLCLKLSAALGENAWLSESRVACQYYYVTLYYLDSEGGSYIQSLQENALLAALLCQAKDGSALWDYLRLAERDSLGLNRPGRASFESLRDSLAGLVRRLDRLRQSPPLGFYRGPVLFSGSAAGVVVQHALLDPQSRLRESLSENSEPAFLLGLQGRKYLPDNFTVRDMPDLQSFQGRRLFGSYRFDHQGQPAQDVTLIERGRIMDFYRGKLPLQRGLGGNSHWRYGGGFPGVVKVEAAGGIPESELLDSLKRRSRDEGAPFGLRITRFMDEDAFKLLRHPLAQSISFGRFASARGYFSLPPPVAMDAVNDTTGGITPVRGFSFDALDSKSLRDISAVGDTPYLLEPQASFSVLCPSLLFNLLDLGGSHQAQPQLPLLP
jgi:hypothetical protein